MPGGEKWAVESFLPILTKITARDEFGKLCVTKIGTDGSGHFAKMIHNGIEHGVMSALCETRGFMGKESWGGRRRDRRSFRLVGRRMGNW
jgi:6-phosphogluconate dehydrogenase